MCAMYVCYAETRQPRVEKLFNPVLKLQHSSDLMFILKVILTYTKRSCMCILNTIVHISIKTNYVDTICVL